MYDIANKKTFDNINNWVYDIKETNPTITQIIIVGNKSDLENKREVGEKEARDFCKKNNFMFFESSIKLFI